MIQDNNYVAEEILTSLSKLSDSTPYELSLFKIATQVFTGNTLKYMYSWKQKRTFENKYHTQ